MEWEIEAASIQERLRQNMEQQKQEAEAEAALHPAHALAENDSPEQARLKEDTVIALKAEYLRSPYLTYATGCDRNPCDRTLSYVLRLSVFTVHVLQTF